jgi:predicted MFS family arabinose efflux permease
MLRRTSSRPTPSMPRQLSERAVVVLIGAVQFVNILDFVMVMPMGPDFAKALGIASSNIGLIGGSYTLAASISGLVGSFFLDRFDRRKALGVAMLGLVAGTACGGLAMGLPSLMAARLFAGVFGGPATSVAYSIVTDVVPGERRGRALGAIMGAFSIASVLGIPLALKLSEVGGWRAPFLAVAALGVLVSVGAVMYLPPLTGHLAAVAARRANPRARASIFGRPEVLLSYSTGVVAMIGGFIIIPNISAYVQDNLGYPRSRLGLLYMIGGVVSFGVMWLAGRLVDRFGASRVGAAGAAALVSILYVGFIDYPPGFPVVGLFIGFMVGNGFRMVAYNTLATKVPGPAERAHFMSLQSCIQHAASAMGAFLSSKMLSVASDHKLIGIDRVAMVSIGLSAVFPALLFSVERRVLRRDARANLAAHPPPAVTPSTR